MAQIITADEFDEKVLKAEKPVLVDFYADWCGPCKMMAPVLDELSGEKADEISIYKINVDNNRELAQKYQVMSIPNMVVFKGGEAVTHVIGSMPKEDLWQQIAAVL